MTKRSSLLARALATLALATGVVVLVVVIAISLGGNGSDGAGGASRKASSGKRHVPASYVVQNGDTLTSIAHKAGVSVRRIQELNPGVDPQILVSGEKLKLRAVP